MRLDLWFSADSYKNVYSRQNINKQIEFFFHRMGSMRNKMHQTFSAGALPRTPLGISRPHSRRGGGYPWGAIRILPPSPLQLTPTVSRPEPHLLHTSTLTTGSAGRYDSAIAVPSITVVPVCQCQSCQ